MAGGLFNPGRLSETVKINYKPNPDFAEFLVSQTPVFDEMIMEDMRFEDGWIAFAWKELSWKERYLETLNAVRSLSEGVAFKRVRMSEVRFPKIKSLWISPMGTLTDITQDRFNAVWPNTKSKWNRRGE